jgi:hypothetical protein
MYNIVFLKTDIRCSKHVENKTKTLICKEHYITLILLFDEIKNRFISGHNLLNTGFRRPPSCCGLSQSVKVQNSWYKRQIKKNLNFTSKINVYTWYNFMLPYSSRWKAEREMTITQRLVYFAYIPLLTNNTVQSEQKRLLFCYFGGVSLSRLLPYCDLPVKERKLKLIHNNFKYRHTTQINAYFKNTVFWNTTVVKTGKYIQMYICVQLDVT